MTRQIIIEISEPTPSDLVHIGAIVSEASFIEGAVLEIRDV